jgi:hypothetical protein
MMLPPLKLAVDRHRSHPDDHRGGRTSSSITLVAYTFNGGRCLPGDLGHDAYAANQRRLTVNVETFDTFPDSQSHAAGRQPRVAKRLPDSLPLAVFGAVSRRTPIR